MERVCATLKHKIMSAERAAAFIQSGMTLATSGFGGVGYPKVIPEALALSGHADHLTVYSSAACGDAMDGCLARAGLVAFRSPYQSVKSMRDSINEGKAQYADLHLSQTPVYAAERLGSHIDVAVVECTAVTENGLIPTAMIGACETYVRMADRVIVELNETVPLSLAGIHDIYDIALPPNAVPIPLSNALDRIGKPYIECPPEKIAAIVYSDKTDELVLRPTEEVFARIGRHICRFLENEVEHGRLPEHLGPLQSGTGSVANAVLSELIKSNFRNLIIFTEVLQDGFIDLLDKGIAVGASTCSLSLSEQVRRRFYNNVEHYKERMIMRPQSITNHPEVIQRLGVVAMNTPIEADIYGNVNSTHIMGSAIMNGIGGSGDFARNARLNIFATESTAKGGMISCIVPMVSHVDHTEHDIHVIVTEQGMADLRWKSPVEKAELIIENCAHPDYRPMLREYLGQAKKKAYGQHTPHDLTKALSWHQRYIETGSMK